jgi:hypothetical protein
VTIAGQIAVDGSVSGGTTFQLTKTGGGGSSGFIDVTARWRTMFSR